MRVERRLDRMLLATFIVCALSAPAGAAQERMYERTVKANVVAFRQVIWLNRLGAEIPDGMMYALARDVVDRNGNSCDNGVDNSSPVTTACLAADAGVHLRDDKRPRPIVLRANEGDRLQIVFTNLLASSGESAFKPFAAALHTAAAEAAPAGEVKDSEANRRLRQDALRQGKRLQGPAVRPVTPTAEAVPPLQAMVALAPPPTALPTTLEAGVHVQGLSWVKGAQDDGSYVGVNPSSLVAPGQSTAYTLFAEHEGSYLLYSTADDWTNPNPGTGADGGTLAQGLFGAVNVQPSGSAIKPFRKKWDAEWYRSQATEQELCLASRDGIYDKGSGRCARKDPDALPVIDYQALYPPDYPVKSRANLPILNMLCNTAAAAHGACQVNEIVHTDLTAIITGPQAGNFPSTILPADQPPALRAISLLPDRLQPYREFTIIYHESFVVEQAFANLYASPNLPSLGSATDNFGINYGMGGIASEILANRIGVGPMKDCLECKYEEFFLSSWTVGDPAMNVDMPASDCVGPGERPILGCKATLAEYPDDPSNVYPSYLGDHVRFRVLHGGSDLHHIHHQHAHQWLHTPNSPNADYTDSQSFGPGSAFTMEMAYYGSGNVNQTVGDSIFHCHFYAHFASGMWSMWRVFDTLQTGTPLDAAGRPAPGVRAYPDGEIAAGTPIPAVVPVPTLPMPLPPAPVRLVDGGKGFEVQLVDAGGKKGSWVSPLQGGVPDQVYRNPGYPFFVPAIAGHRPPHPPLDFAYACSDNGLRCAPGTAGEPRDLSLCRNPATATCEPLDGGLPRHLIYAGTDSTPALNNTDFSKILTQTRAFQIAEEGTLVEQIAMKTHSQRLYSTCLPDGRCAGVCSDNGAPCDDGPGGHWQCASPAATCDAKGPITFVLNGLPPKPGAPYADPCIRFDRNGGAAPDMLTRRYQAADIQLDAVFNKEGWHFPQERMISLWGDVKSFLDRQKAPEPFFFRANSNDCIEYTLANLVPNVYELDDFQVRTPTDILGQHIHLVKFDVTSSDGAANGWNYEDGTFAPNEVTERIHAINSAGGIDRKFVGGAVPQTLTAKPIPFFGGGPGGTWIGAQATIQRWFADPLYDNAGACSNNPDLPCTLVDLSQCRDRTAICDVTAGFCANDQRKSCTAITSLARCGKPGECIARHDRTIRTVFTHDHFGPSTHQQAGLYAGLVVEPEGSVWRDNQTGSIFGGYDAATGRNIVKRFDGGPTSWQAVVEAPKRDQSFREFLLELQDSTLTYQPFAVRDFILDPQDPNWRGQFACGKTDPCVPGEPCGFCGNDGVCVNTQTGLPVTPVKTCLVPVPFSACDPCGNSDQACRLFAGVPASGSRPAVPGQLVACTPENFKGCLGQDYGDPNAGPLGVFKSCKLISGFPGVAWGTTPIDPAASSTPEVITFSGATNNFSFNYRNEPLFPRITDVTSGTVLPGSPGDLGYVFSSLINRPSPLGSLCSANLALACDSLTACPTGAGTCQAASFCSDNYALCTAGNRTLCGNPVTAQCNRTAPYPPLTAGVQGGDPYTPLLRAYPGDDLQIRTLTGAHLNPHNFTVQGMNWLMQPSFVDSGWRNSQVMGISEHFDLMTRVPPSYSAATTDFLYQPGAAAIEQASGNWGLLRSYGQVQEDLYRLPQNPQPGRPVAVCPASQPPGTAVRTYNVVALPAPLTYNSTQGLSDANGIVYYQCPAGQPLASCAPPTGWQPQPLVLRAGAGDCIKVNLRNAIPAGTQIKGASDLQRPHPAGCKLPDYPPAPSNCGGTGQTACCLSSNTSLQVGLRPQLVGFDARASGGANVGLNPLGTIDQPVNTATPGQTVSYTWYAGNIDLKATTEAARYIPIEFGSANLLPPDILNHWGHGLFGALIIEPLGSTGWENGGGTSVKVTEPDGSSFQEFVVFTQDNIPQTGGAIEGVNYGSELLGTSRLCQGCASGNLSCTFTNSPFSGTPGSCTASTFTPATPTFTACVGDSVRFRVLHPGGINTNQVFEIYGHNWSESPYETDYGHCEAPTTQTNLWASQKQGTTNLCAGLPYLPAKLAAAQRTQGDWEASLNTWQGSRMGQGPTNHLDILLAQAGGPFHQTGTYLYRTFPAMHFALGLWGWFNVVSCPEPPRPDSALKNQLPAGGGTR